MDRIVPVQPTGGLSKAAKVAGLILGGTVVAALLIGMGSVPALAGRRDRDHRRALAVGSAATWFESIVPNNRGGECEIDEKQVGAELSRGEMHVVATNDGASCDKAPSE